MLVVGGGPAGSSAACLLAAQGWRVCLVERERHPRFHIGESLLPQSMPLLERLGVLPAVRARCVLKEGADFTDPRLGRQEVRFANALNAGPAYAFHVERALFDALLLDNARAKGVCVHEQTTARNVDLTGDRVRLEVADAAGERRTLCGRQLVDASGHDGFLARKLALRRRHPKHQTAAVYGHFTGVQRQDGAAAGNISVYWFAHGWCWMIPLAGGLMSVGAVCSREHIASRQGDLGNFLAATLQSCPGIAARMGAAERVGPARAASNYSYDARCMAGPHHVMIGDAFAFLDPIFSSGVHFALTGASLAADAVGARLAGAADAEVRIADLERRMRRGLAIMAWLIYRFNAPALRWLFLNPRNVFGVVRTLSAIVAGDVFGRTPITARYTLFKAIYYSHALFHHGRRLLGARSDHADPAALPGQLQHHP